MGEIQKSPERVGVGFEERTGRDVRGLVEVERRRQFYKRTLLQTLVVHYIEKETRHEEFHLRTFYTSRTTSSDSVTICYRVSFSVRCVNLIVEITFILSGHVTEYGH